METTEGLHYLYVLHFRVEQLLLSVLLIVVWNQTIDETKDGEKTVRTK